MATPTLKRTWGFSGLSGNNSDTVNNLKIHLEALSTPRAVAAGDLVLVSAAFHNGLTCTISDDNSNTWTSAASVANTGLTTARKYQIFWAIAKATGTGSIQTITVGFGGLTTDVQIRCTVYYNTDTVTVIGNTKTQTGITPANNTAPNVSFSTSLTVTSGSLVHHEVWNEANGTVGNNNAFTTTTPLQFGSGFTGLNGDICAVNGGTASIGYGTGAQFQVIGGTSVNPGMTFSQTTHDSYAAIAIEVLAGTGGSAPANGISIIRSQTAYIVSTAGAFLCPFPAQGNLIVVCNEAGSVGASLTSVTDSNSNTYTAEAGHPAQFPQYYHADGPTVSNGLTLTLHTGSASGNDLCVIYDVTGAATSPLDTGAIAANSSTITTTNSGATKNSGTNSASVSDASSIKPSTANGLVFAAVQNGTGPMFDCTTGTFDYCAPSTSAGWSSGGGDNNGFTNGDGQAHFFNSSASTENFTWSVVNNGVSWNSMAIAFKAAPVGSGIPFEDDSFNPSTQAVLVQQAEPIVSVW